MKKWIMSALLLALALTLTGCGCKHENTEIKNAAAATCVAEGYTGDTVCTECQKTLAKGGAIAAVGHTRGEVTGALDPTCTQAGYTGDTLCAVCGEIAGAGEAIAAAGHSAAAERANVREGSCMQKGYTGDILCSACGEVLEAGVQGEMGSHVGVTLWAVDATCTEDGYSGDVYCDYCDLLLIPGGVVPAKGHALADTSAQVMATCTREGSWGVGECANCGEYIDGNTMALLPHSFANGVCSACGWLTPGLYQNGTCVVTWQELLDRGDVEIGGRDEELAILNPELTGTLVIADDVRLPDYGLMRSGTSGITSLYLPVTVRSIPEEFLRGAPGITELRVFGDMQALGKCTLAYSSLTGFEIPASVKEIRDGAFYKSGLRSITIPATVENMGAWVFSESMQLESVVFESGSLIAALPKETFYGCEALKSVTLPEGMTAIGSAAFTKCDVLETVVLPSTLQDLSYAFANCKALKTVYFRGTQAQWDAVVDNNLPQGAQLVVEYAD